MPQDWTQEEVAATVADYFAMLTHELYGQPFSKREHNRELQGLLRDRSSGAIEFKHQNISAILIEQGFPYIEGYKPRANYQNLLRSEVLVQLMANTAMINAAATVVNAPAEIMHELHDVSNTIVPAPTREPRPDRIYERAQYSSTPLLGVNYLERESRNASLGAAGERFIMDLEHKRLWMAGKRQLAERIEHVSNTRGDGLGYDISSFDTDGTELLIEVKTTNFGPMTPFFASKREVAVSEEYAMHFRLYRLFKFRTEPKVFVLPGSLQQSCVLEPTQFRARLS